MSDFKRLRLFLFALASGSLLFLTQCERSEDTKEASSTEIDGVPVTTYQVTGVIKELKPDGRTVIIDHEEIPGYMAAMVMPFRVKDETLLEGLEPGDEVTFRMIVSATEGWIDQVQQTGRVIEFDPNEESTHDGHGMMLSPGDVLPDHAFVNEFGESVRLSDFRGMPVALTFIFTRCPFPEFCPRLARQFAETAALLKADPEMGSDWRLLAISIDPEYDTPEILKAYGETYGYDPAVWSFLVGSMETTREIGGQLGLLFDKGEGIINHNLRTAVLDPDGMIRSIHLDANWKPEGLAAEMKAAVS